MSYFMKESQVNRFYRMSVSAKIYCSQLSKDGARVETPVALLRMDTLTSVSTELESSSEEDSSRDHLDGPTLSVRTMGQINFL